MILFFFTHFSGLLIVGVLFASYWGSCGSSHREALNCFPQTVPIYSFPQKITFEADVLIVMVLNSFQFPKAQVKLLNLERFKFRAQHKLRLL